MPAQAALAPDLDQDEIWRWITTEADLAAVPHKLAILARHWFEQRQPGRTPARRAIDPAALKPVLPYILMFGLERAGDAVAAIRIRLMGTALVRIYDRDWTGLTTRDFDREDKVADHLARMQGIADRGLPLYWRHYSLARGTEDLFAEHLFCPLTDADGTVAYMITVLDFPGMENDPRVRDSFSPLLLRHG